MEGINGAAAEVITQLLGMRSEAIYPPPSTSPPANGTASPEAPPSSPSSSENEAETPPQVALLFIGISLTIGALCRQLLQRTRIPYTVALLLVGVGLGALDFYFDLGVLGESIHMWANIDPDLVLFVFLPALLFESAFAFEFHQVKRCIMQMFLLAVPGVAISTAFLGVTNKYCLPYGWDWTTSLLLGGLLSATDPVAVVALLRELGASKKLSTIIDGEALMNDGTAIVVFQLFLHLAMGDAVTPGAVIAFLFRVTLGGIALGVAFAIVALLWLRTVFNDYIIEITLTLAAAYMAFFVANDITGMSGVLSDMTLGIIFAIFAKTALTGESETAMHHFWEMVAYIANTLIFILSGVVIAESTLEHANYIQGHDWGYMVLLYVFMQLSRVVVVGVLYPGLAFSGYGLNWREALVLIWSGLRGAVALTLALIISREQSEETFSYETQARFIFLTGGVVFLTLIINGTTTQFLVAVLQLNKTSDVKKRIVEFTRHEMHDHALKAFEGLGDDQELGPADWNTVRTYLTCLNHKEVKGSAGGSGDKGSGGGVFRTLFNRLFGTRHQASQDQQHHQHHHHHHHHHNHHHRRQEEEGGEGRGDGGGDGGDVEREGEGQGGEGGLVGGGSGSAATGKRKASGGWSRRNAARSAEYLKEQHLQDMRMRFLNGVQASYWSMLEGGRINQTAAMLLMQSVAEAMDYTKTHHRLGLWEGLKPHVRMPPYLRELHRMLRGKLPARWTNWLTVDRLELAASMSAAFLRANRHARIQLKNFLKDSTICDQVLAESVEEEEMVKKFLEDVRLNFPEVLTNIKTKQVTNAILLDLLDYVKGLEEAGLLEEKETIHLRSSVESDMKKVLRKPPYVALLPAAEVLLRQPLIGALPVDLRQQLTSQIKEHTMKSNSPLFSENDFPDGVWIIATGVAKWSSNKANADSLIGTVSMFSHGCTVGLYESLAGMPRLSTVTADSVLHCFFIDRQRILAAQQSSSAVCDFLWKESALELARIYLARMLGDTSATDLRLLLTNNSTLLTLERGSTLDVGPADVALLLLGSVELLSADAADAEAAAAVAAASASAALAAPNEGDGDSHEGAATQPLTQLPSSRAWASSLVSLIPAPACLTHIHQLGGGRRQPEQPTRFAVRSDLARAVTIRMPSAGDVGTAASSLAPSPHGSTNFLLPHFGGPGGHGDHDALLRWPSSGDGDGSTTDTADTAVYVDDSGDGDGLGPPSAPKAGKEDGNVPPAAATAVAAGAAAVVAAGAAFSAAGSATGQGNGNVATGAASDGQDSGRDAESLLGRASSAGQMTLPPSAAISDALREALSMDRKLSERALQLSVFGSKERPEADTGLRHRRHHHHHAGHQHLLPHLQHQHEHQHQQEQRQRQQHRLAQEGQEEEKPLHPLLSGNSAHASSHPILPRPPSSTSNHGEEVEKRSLTGILTPLRHALGGLFWSGSGSGGRGGGVAGNEGGGSGSVRTGQKQAALSPSPRFTTAGGPKRASSAGKLPLRSASAQRVASDDSLKSGKDVNGGGAGEEKRRGTEDPTAVDVQSIERVRGADSDEEDEEVEVVVTVDSPSMLFGRNKNR